MVIWDGQSRSNAFANKFTNIFYLGLAGPNEFYNYPMWFNQNAPGNLYEFHAIENPRVSGYQGFDFECEVEFDCNLLNSIDVEGVVKTSRGDSKGPLTIVENHINNTLTIKGTV